MLNFIGCGSAFNTDLGNNSAFIKKENVLFMIDCGGSTFTRIVKSGLLENVERIGILLTHTHADHIGSLPDLIYYSKNLYGKPNVQIFAPYELRVDEILKLMGVGKHNYELIEFSNAASFRYDAFQIEFEAISVNHVVEISCFGYVLQYDGKVIYYSGDTNEIPDDILQKQNAGYFNYFYQDTSKADFDANIHLSLRKLNELIQPNFRERVFCMHLDTGFSKEEANNLGFNVVSSYI